jgi:putative SOS response-associated peptidase YedK
VCGRTTSTSPLDRLARSLGVEEIDTPELPLRWNVAPTQPVYAVGTNSAGARKLRALRWGLVPSWANDATIGVGLINARSETLAQRPAFRNLVGGHRVLLPFSGFYEWRRLGTMKQPFYFRARNDEFVVMAGLWDSWRDAEGVVTRTCTIITTAANSTMAPVHHRMPVVLTEDVWAEWIGPGALSEHRLAGLLAPAPDDLLSSHPVSDAVNSAANDTSDLILQVPERHPAPGLFDSSAQIGG